MLWIVQAVLLVIFAFAFTYLWSRRKIYYLSWNMKGPIAYPFIGNAWMFLNPSCGNLKLFKLKVNVSMYFHRPGTINLISKLGQKYGSLSRFWLGSRMLVYMDSPEDMETLIKSDIQDKGGLYDNISDFIGGHGLLSLNGKLFGLMKSTIVSP